MPGGIPHWVLGTSNAMCVGRHFYSTSTIRSSVIAIVHTFLLRGTLTNEDHLATRTLLCQMMVFWSLRLDQTDVDGEFETSIKSSRSNLGQGPTYRTFPLRLDSWTFYTWVCSSSSPLPLMGDFTRPSNLGLPSSQSFPMPPATSNTSSMFSPSAS